jgi:hypothetical protein
MQAELDLFKQFSYVHVFVQPFACQLAHQCAGGAGQLHKTAKLLCSDCNLSILLYCYRFQLASWPISALEELAHYSPALASYWRSFILYSVASEFEHRAHKGMAR